MNKDLKDDEVIALIRRGLTPRKLELATACRDIETLQEEFGISITKLNTLRRMWGIAAKTAEIGDGFPEPKVPTRYKK